MQDSSKFPDMYKYDSFLKDLNKNHELESKIRKYLNKSIIYKESPFVHMLKICSIVRLLMRNLSIRK